MIHQIDQQRFQRVGAGIEAFKNRIAQQFLPPCRVAAVGNPGVQCVKPPCPAFDRSEFALVLFGLLLLLGKTQRLFVFAAKRLEFLRFVLRIDQRKFLMICRVDGFNVFCFFYAQICPEFHLSKFSSVSV